MSIAARTTPALLLALVWVLILASDAVAAEAQKQPTTMSLNPGYAFSVSDYQCALQVYSAAHEIGHTIGMNHDRFVERNGQPGPHEFNFGFVAVQGGIRSLMAYNNQCAEQKKNCNRVLFLSSPNIRLGGGPFGRPLDHPEAAYKVETLCRNASAVSRFR